MIVGLEQFAADMRRFARDDVPQLHAQAVRKVGLQILTGVVLRTPVDTGRARANWTVSSGEPSRIASDEARDTGGMQTIAAGTTRILALKPLQQVLWISNNLPYIEALENGHSKQAPQGMVELTLAEVNAVNGIGGTP